MGDQYGKKKITQQEIETLLEMTKVQAEKEINASYYVVMIIEKEHSNNTQLEIDMTNKLFDRFIENDLGRKIEQIKSFNKNDNEVILLVWAETELEMRVRYTQVANYIKRISKESFRQKVTIGIGNIVNDFEEIEISYKEADRAKCFKYIKGKNDIFKSESLELSYAANLDFSKHDESKVVSFLRWGKVEELEDLLSILFDEKAYIDSVIYMYYMRLHIINLISKFIKKMDSNLADVMKRGDIVEACFKTSDIEELKSLYKVIFIEVLRWRDENNMEISSMD